MERSDAVLLVKMWSILRWAVFVVGLLVNLWAFWVMASEIGKELFRFGQLPNVSTVTGFLDWCKSVFFLGWLPKDALFIYLFKKLIFAGCNAVFFVVLFAFYTKGNRSLALATAGLVLVNLVLIFSPAVGNLR